MTINEDERAALGALVASERGRRFGTKRAAYNKAEVNAATWDKVEAGELVRGDRLRLVVKTLWPETDGDWTRVPALGTSAASAPETSARSRDDEDDVANALARATPEQLALELLRRTGQPTAGQQRRAELDSLGEESQDPGNEEPS